MLKLIRARAGCYCGIGSARWLCTICSLLIGPPDVQLTLQAVGKMEGLSLVLWAGDAGDPRTCWPVCAMFGDWCGRMSVTVIRKQVTRMHSFCCPVIGLVSAVRSIHASLCIG